MIEVAAERLRVVKPELWPLLEAHWREVALYQDKVPLAPIWEQYESLDDSGHLLFISARKDGALVGYSVFLLREHAHYRGHWVAANDVIYLDPGLRRGRNGLELIKQSEYLCKVMGADRVIFHIKVDHDWSPILKRLGYVHTEILLEKYTGA